MALPVSGSNEFRGRISDAEPSEIRRSARTGDGRDFRQVMETMRRGMELAMADRFLSLGVSLDGGEAGPGEELSGLAPGLAGVSKLDSLKTNMLLTMTGLSQAAPGSRRSRAAAGAGKAGNLAGDDGLLTVLGELSKSFESGDRGPGTVGYDARGGTSYGSYQISSRQGSMDNFIEFLDSQAPRLARRLRAAGPADTGSTEGRMPKTWERLAAEDPEGFESLQREFVSESHYKPALARVLDMTGLTEADLPPAVKEVVFSTAVQHGPSGAAAIFRRALTKLEELGPEAFPRLIETVYSLRARRFGGSTGHVRAAVATRLENEKDMALQLLAGGGAEQIVT